MGRASSAQLGRPRVGWIVRDAGKRFAPSISRVHDPLGCRPVEPGMVLGTGVAMIGPRQIVPGDALAIQRCRPRPRRPDDAALWRGSAGPRRRTVASG